MGLPEPYIDQTRSIPTIVKGKVWKFGDNINTESMMSTEAHLGSFTEERLKREMMSFYDPEFGPNFKENDIIVGGTNFGCSSSRGGSYYLKRYGIGAIVVESVSQIFYRNTWSFGLPIFECPGITGAANKGDTLEVNIETGSIRNLSSGKTLQAERPIKYMLDMVKAGDEYRYLKSHGEL